MSTVVSGVTIPKDCSSEQLFQDASEVVTLSTDLAGLEDQFESKFFEYYVNGPVGVTDKGREMYALNQIKTEHPDLWVQIDAKRARMKGLTLKASILNAAARIASIESGHNIPS